MSHVHDEGRAPSAIDLNLLVAFDALARERSVTRAAAHLGVTQSAMSHTLRRLRSMFDDALLVRTGRGMSLTPKAEALAMPVAEGLNALRRALDDPASFDPATSRRDFRLWGPDLFELLFIPEVMTAFGGPESGLSLAVAAARPSEVPSLLATGELDVAITNRMLDGSAPSDEPGLMRRTLLEDDWRCFVRVGHPGLSADGKRLSLRAFLAAPHVMVSPAGRGPGLVDQLLAERGEARRIALRVGRFYAAPVVVARSDMVLTAPTSLERVIGHLGVVAVACPLELPPHSVDMTWHVRMQDDPAHRWFRERLIEAVRRVAPPDGRKRKRRRSGAARTR